VFADPAGELLDRPVIVVRNHRSNIHGRIPLRFIVKGELLPDVLLCQISFCHFSFRGGVQNPRDNRLNRLLKSVQGMTNTIGYRDQGAASNTLILSPANQGIFLFLKPFYFLLRPGSNVLSKSEMD